MNKIINDREVMWDTKYFKEELQKLSLRIQEDIQTIPFPKFDKVESCYICGNTGTGKTISAVFMMLSELKSNFIERKHINALFISIPELLLEFKNIYSNKESVITENKLVEKYSDVYLLILDDFGVEKITDWSFQLLYIIINRRYENKKKTIFTSNFSLNELAERLGDDRLPSRIQQMCKIKKSGNKDYRVR